MLNQLATGIIVRCPPGPANHDRSIIPKASGKPRIIDHLQHVNKCIVMVPHPPELSIREKLHFLAGAAAVTVADLCDAYHLPCAGPRQRQAHAFTAADGHTCTHTGLPQGARNSAQFLARWMASILPPVPIWASMQTT